MRLQDCSASLAMFLLFTHLLTRQQFLEDFDSNTKSLLLNFDYMLLYIYYNFQ